MPLQSCILQTGEDAASLGSAEVFTSASKVQSLGNGNASVQHIRQMQTAPFITEFFCLHAQESHRCRAQRLQYQVLHHDLLLWSDVRKPTDLLSAAGHKILLQQPLLAAELQGLKLFT